MEGSVGAYRTGLARFREFITSTASELHCSPPPLESPCDVRALVNEPIIAAGFAGQLFLDGLQASTASNYLNAVRFFGTSLEGCPEPPSAAEKLIVRGFANLAATRPGTVKSKRPTITIDILAKMVARAGAFQKPEAALLRAVLTMGFYGCLRVSEYLRSKDSGKMLRLEDVSFDEERHQMILHLRKSKTNQRGPPQKVVIAATGDATCPVQAMLAYLAVRPTSAPTDPLFFSMVAGRPLTSSAFNRSLKVIAKMLGLADHNRYSSHALRSGSATSAVMGGASHDEVKALGRWRSDAVEGYIRLQAQRADAQRGQSALHRAGAAASAGMTTPRLD